MAFTMSHTAGAAERRGDAAPVWTVLRDLENSLLDEKHKALFRFVIKGNEDSARITPGDLQPVYAAGCPDRRATF